VTRPFDLSLLFFNVLLDQLGVPLPAVPALIVAGALLADGRLPAVSTVLVVLSACLIGDAAWYSAGRLYGARVMKLLCRVSLTPDVCVSQTQSVFERWGPRALIVAKFVPGLSLIAPPLAGALRMGFARFIVFSLIGSTLWSGAALVIGMLVHSQVERLLPRLAALGSRVVLILALLLAAYIAFRWWERRRFYAALDVARISVAELHAQIESGAAPVVVDVRSNTAQTLQHRRIPGALHVPVQDVGRHVSTLPRDREIIFYCTCPNEASAAQAARLLMRHGFRHVRPLHGGLDAWIAAGYAVEELPGGTPAATSLALPAAAR
jgi:membrane protein DedA with SNARE-associated domain/rhodanese-related sulfurtransferase